METVHPLITNTSHVALPTSLDAVFIPDGMTPEQWVDHLHRPSEPDPEHRLVLAVMEDAIRCLKTPHAERYSNTIRRCVEAELWFKDHSTRPFSFVWCCDMMGWNPDEIRKALAVMPLTKRIGRRRPNIRYSQIGEASKGGIARAEGLSPERKQDIARRAANERWLHNLGYR